MSLRDWIANKKKKQLNAALVESKISGDDLSKLWVKCFNCSANLPSKDLEKNLSVCPECDYHFRISANARINQLVDEGTFTEINPGIHPADPLDFTDTMPYKDRQRSA